MAATDDSGDRRVVPRWKTVKDALRAGELDGTITQAPKAIDGTQFLTEREIAWKDNSTLPFAIDLVGASIVLGKSVLAVEAAEFILASSSHVSHPALSLAHKLLGITPPSVEGVSQDTPSIQREIATLKVRRIEEKKNAFVWLDLARNYMLLGHVTSAEASMKVAIGLAPYDRFILRCAARFLLHCHKPDEALHMLRLNPKTAYDPWLIASEIALSSVLDKVPKYLKDGERLIQSANFSNFHTSELASALGSIEMFNGRNRAANKLFKLAMRSPNDNALAQIIWASKKTGFADIEEHPRCVWHASEAITLDHHNHGRWKDVVDEAKIWAEEESFSSRPHLLASGVCASLLNNLSDAKKIAEAGLPTNPGPPGLLNNIAFCASLLGQPEAAFKAIQQVDRKFMTPNQAICLVATLGLAHFRSGNIAEGTANYEAAIAAAKRASLPTLHALARLYFGRELHLNGDNRGMLLINEAYESAQKIKTTTIPAVAATVVEEIHNNSSSLLS